MRYDLLGLELSAARAMLEAEGIDPVITVTRAPRRQEDDGCTFRVVYASDDAKQLTVSSFADPLADGLQEND